MWPLYLLLNKILGPEEEGAVESQRVNGPLVGDDLDLLLQSVTYEKLCVGRKCRASMQPRSEFVDVPHINQLSSWDCGIACILMVLRTMGIGNCNLETLAELCSTKSIWTIDLAYLLKKFCVKFSYYTITVGANPNYSAETFYKEQLSSDVVRVEKLFREAVASGISIKSFIVYMGHRQEGDTSAAWVHISLLEKVIGGDVAPNCLLHSYKRSFNGFVAMLTEGEAEIISGLDEVVSVFPNKKIKLHTTRSWNFMGFSEQVERVPSIESDIIVGVLDTGIWPESASFADEGFGPPPSKWKGTCQVSSNFTCNNKIIGARYYRHNTTFVEGDLLSPRDSEGHGTHTASTIAGNNVGMASLYGLASGTARGGVPSARIAVYKVCWSDGCLDEDILAAFDDAIADGVDIISASLGAAPTDYFYDSLAIGAFHAMKAGILTSNSGGNDGPDYYTVSNISPWSISVAASTIDRKFSTKVQLGDGTIYKGVSINTFDLKGVMYPIIYGGDAPNLARGFSSSESRLCDENSLDGNVVRGKIVLCDGLNTTEPLRKGAVGVVSRADGGNDTAYIFPLPESYITADEGASIYYYSKLNSFPNATIYKSVEENDTLAPFVASFSSRGPNLITSGILKPDLTAPGVDILAAYSPANPISGVPGDNRFAPYSIISGTSMSCPHVSAVAAYIKSFHPTWSPAAIKSALMTTARPMSDKTNPEAEFAYGAGHIDPLRAINPGLVYDADEIDYVKFLCGEGYSTRILRIVTGDERACSASNWAIVWDLNYPSFSVPTSTYGTISRTFTRTVTNVGSPSSVYKSRVIGPTGLSIQVTPSELSYQSLGEKQSFKVTIQGTINGTIESASLIWYDGTYEVRSPIVLFKVAGYIPPPGPPDVSPGPPDLSPGPPGRSPGPPGRSPGPGSASSSPGRGVFGLTTGLCVLLVLVFNQL